MPATDETEPSKINKRLGDPAVALAGCGAESQMATERLRVKTRPADGLTLSAVDRAALSDTPAAPGGVHKELAKAGADLTVTDVAGSLPAADPKQQTARRGIAARLMACLQANLVMPVEPTDLL